MEKKPVLNKKLRVLVIGKFYQEGFALHIAETLSRMGHEVSRYEPGLRYRSGTRALRYRLRQAVVACHELSDRIPAIREHRTRRLLNAAVKYAPDLILSCHDFLLPSEVRDLKQSTGASIVLWFPDAIINFGRSYFMNAPYDALFFKDPFITRTLGSVLKTPIYYLPECFNPRRHRMPTLNGVDLTTYQCDITTAGNVHAYRVAVFRQLEGYNVKLWGNPLPLWLDAGPVRAMLQGKYVANEEKALAFGTAKIVLNTLHPTEVWGVNVRTFEAAGIGAFQLVDWRPGLEQLFEDGKELVSFSNIEDLKSKIDYYLPRNEERIAIAYAGKKRAHREHTYEHRLSLLLQTLYGSEQGFPLPTISYQRSVSF